MTYLITGATGNIGGLVVERLLEQGHRPRLLVRSEAKARERFGARVDVALGDLSELAPVNEALLGIAAVFLVSAGQDIIQQDRNVVRAAQSAGVQHIVKLSSMDVHRSGASTLGAWHAEGERALRDSGIAFTFVQPSGFMSNALAWARSIKSEAGIQASTGGGKVALIAPADVADVAVLSLTRPELRGASLPITGPEALNYSEMTQIIADALGRELSFRSITDAEARERLIAHGAPPPVADALTALWRAVREDQLATVTDTVARVLGRSPTPFADWVRQNLQEFS